MSSTASDKIIPLAIIDATPLAPGAKQLAADKIARNPVTFDPTRPLLRKPAWIRVRIPAGNAVAELKTRLRHNGLVTVCEEASCPNIHECFSKGTATFMVLGDVCTRRCAFCDVAHGRPKPPDAAEPAKLARTIHDMRLRYVVITSVDRDDLADGGAAHFADCIRQVRELSPRIRVEVLVPDFRGKGRMERALAALEDTPPDVFNHNLETVRERYREVRPGADYDWSLNLLARFKAQHPQVPTKSGIMLGLGETLPQVEQALRDLSRISRRGAISCLHGRARSRRARYASTVSAADPLHRSSCGSRRPRSSSVAYSIVRRERALPPRSSCARRATIRHRGTRAVGATACSASKACRTAAGSQMPTRPGS